MANRVLTDAERIVLLGHKVSEEISNPFTAMAVGDLVVASFKVKQYPKGYLWFRGEGTILEYRGDLVRIGLITPVDAGPRYEIREIWTFRSMCEPRLTSGEI